VKASHWFRVLCFHRTLCSQHHHQCHYFSWFLVYMIQLWAVTVVSTSLLQSWCMAVKSKPFTTKMYPYFLYYLMVVCVRSQRVTKQSLVTLVVVGLCFCVHLPTDCLLNSESETETSTSRQGYIMYMIS
jgi:hypothetical protein